jgi:uncharacterized protein (TIGR02001 family)
MVKTLLRTVRQATLGVLLIAALLCPLGKSVYGAGILDELNLDVDISGTLDFYSDYVWRGFLLDRDPVLQPGIDISAYGFTFSFWSSWDTDNNQGGQSDEIDYVIDYTKAINDLLSVSVGHTYYDFPAVNLYSREFYVGLGLSKIPGLEWPIETSLTYYRDYGDQNHGGGLGTYVSLDMAYSLLLHEDTGTSLDFGYHFGYNRKLFIAGTSGYDIGLSLALTLPLTDTLTMTPSINYSIPLSDLKNANDGNQPERFYTGVSFAYAF